jgi:cytochrome c oxidase assembly protein Cox11
MPSGRGYLRLTLNIDQIRLKPILTRESWSVAVSIQIRFAANAARRVKWRFYGPQEQTSSAQHKNLFGSYKGRRVG